MATPIVKLTVQDNVTTSIDIMDDSTIILTRTNQQSVTITAPNIASSYLEGTSKERDLSLKPCPYKIDEQDQSIQNSLISPEIPGQQMQPIPVFRPIEVSHTTSSSGGVSMKTEPILPSVADLTLNQMHNRILILEKKTMNLQEQQREMEKHMSRVSTELARLTAMFTPAPSSPSAAVKSVDSLPTYGPKFITREDLVGIPNYELPLLISRIRKNVCMYRDKPEKAAECEVMNRNLELVRTVRDERKQ